MPVDIRFEQLSAPTSEVVSRFTKWENDQTLVHLSRPNTSQADIERKIIITPEELHLRLKQSHIYLIYKDDQLVGEMSFSIDPQHLYKKVSDTAWIGITIGEEAARGKGLGVLAMQHLEDEVCKAGCTRIELGVFEFNTPAQKLYQKMGYAEIGRIPGFTFWQNKMWTDIRMEKYVLKK